jgi:hypothetical protein
MLTEEHKAAWKSVCVKLLNYWKTDDQNFLLIITGFETWVHYYDPEPK